MTNDKQRAQLYLLAYAMRAVFSIEEIATLAARGYSVQQMVAMGLHLEISQEEAQKVTLALMSRLPWEDPKDLIIMAFNLESGNLTKRKAFGPVDTDGLAEMLATIPADAVGKLKGFIEAKVGKDRNQQYVYIQGNDSPLDITSDAAKKAPVIGVKDTFADGRIADRFPTLVSPEGSARWRDI